MLAVSYLWCVVWCMMSAVCCWLMRGVHCPLRVALFVVGCLLCAVWCLLFVIRCLLCVAGVVGCWLFEVLC